MLTLPGFGHYHRISQGGGPLADSTGSGEPACAASGATPTLSPEPDFLAPKGNDLGLSHRNLMTSPAMSIVRDSLRAKHLEWPGHVDKVIAGGALTNDDGSSVIGG